MSTLFARHSYAGRLRASYRRYRATPHRGLGGPIVLAAALALGGHTVASRADVRLPATPSAFAESAPDGELLVGTRSGRTSNLLGEPVAGAAIAVGGDMDDVLARRILDRASRTASRTAAVTPAKPKPAVQRRVAPPAQPRWTRPTGGSLTSAYGPRWGRMHRGLDFGAGYGAPVRAAYDGVITFAAFDTGGYGKQVRIRHAGGVVTTYSHMSKIVVTGGRVKAGDVIGKIGSTGNSTGPHLHFEVISGGSNVNPRPFLRARGVRV